MYLKANDDFTRIEWEGPEAAEQAWYLDGQHCPYPIPPLPADLFHEWIRRALHAPSITVNGYVYQSRDAQPSPRDYGRPPAEVWDEEFSFRVRDKALAIRNASYPDTKVAESLRAFDEALEQSVEAFTFTMDIIGAMDPLVGSYLAFCQRVLGPEGRLEAMTAAASGANATLDSAIGLERLAGMADGEPAVASEILAGEAWSEIRRMPAAAEFAREFDRYLDEYGWRCDTWADLQKPLWVEAPDLPLGMVRRYLEAPDQRPSAAIESAARKRDAAVARVEAAIEDPEKLAEFRAMVESMRDVTRVVEHRAAWQQVTFGCLKVPALALGRALASAGHIDEPGDVFYLGREELRAIADGAAWPGDRQVIVERKGALVRWAALLPPATLGRLEPAREGAPPVGANMPWAPNTGTPRVIRGVGASRGTARGRARVVRSLEEAELVQPGEILVCTMTTPPWTPLFSLVAGIVTDAGGMLGHAAITAREYGIPAVLGTLTCTRDIPDGALVTIDGAAGTVTIEG